MRAHGVLTSRKQFFTAPCFLLQTKVIQNLLSVQHVYSEKTSIFILQFDYDI